MAKTIDHRQEKSDLNRICPIRRPLCLEAKAKPVLSEPVTGELKGCGPAEFGRALMQLFMADQSPARRPRRFRCSRLHATDNIL